jgi:hypothetical protein
MGTTYFYSTDDFRVHHRGAADFSFEASEVTIGGRLGLPNGIVLTNPRTGGSRMYADPQTIRRNVGAVETEIVSWAYRSKKGGTIYVYND